MSAETAKPKGQSYAIVGAGAVGGYYGGRLANTGCDVHFLFHNDYDSVASNGLSVKSIAGDFHVKVRAYRSARDMPRVDLVIVALKSQQNALLPELLPPLIHGRSAVTSLQNGFGSEESIAEIIGRGSVIGGTAFICSERESPGVIGHYAAGALAFAPYQDPSAETTRRMEMLIVDFQKAGVRVSRGSSAKEITWKKLLWNIPFSGLSVYYGGVTTNRILNDPVRLKFARDIMEDVVKAAAVDGVMLAPDLIEKNIEATRPMGAYRPSMMVDYEKGRPLEIDAIFAEPLRRGTSTGQDLSALEKLHEGIVKRTKE